MNIWRERVHCHCHSTITSNIYPPVDQISGTEHSHTEAVKKAVKVEIGSKLSQAVIKQHPISSLRECKINISNVLCLK